MSPNEGRLSIAREIEKQITELEQSSDSLAAREEIDRLKQQVIELRRDPEGEPKSRPGAWDRVLMARHPQRPYTLDYIQAIFTDFMELHGDRRYGDDPALIAGLGRLEGRPVMVLGQQKGRDTKQKLLRNFGMPNPEGYRKALRLMQLAAKFGVSIVTLIDTPGAYPGTGAEERGQAEAIAYNLKEIPKLAVPIVVVIHGEGGSGGALAIAIGDKILMLENATYSVIAPESCSSILWRDWNHKQEAARLLKLTAEDLRGFGIVDEVIPEPPTGAHTDLPAMAVCLRAAIGAALASLESLSPEELRQRRNERWRRIATFVTAG
jgi:acetyl-CoA carboxylase carboxyl transferase subunit alpha